MTFNELTFPKFYEFSLPQKFKILNLKTWSKIIIIFNILK